MAVKNLKAQDPGDVIDQQLARYRSMRDFSITAEPSGKSKPKSAKTLPFVIQKHAASRLHYDFRLGWNGVLKSWACAKGPSYHVGDKRLAVQVEDHPMEYGGFEGIIPAGQYGGGTVMLWDEGSWAPQPGYEDVDAGLRDGHLKFTMQGTKMHGKWALIRMGGRFAKESKAQWLLIKEHDEFELPESATPITEAEPNSVVTARSLDQIAAHEDHVWASKETQEKENSGGRAWHRQPAKTQEPTPAARKPAKASPALAASTKALPKEHQPTFLKPQLAEEGEAPPEGSAWLHELKLDGYRMQARKDGAKVQMLTRSGLDWTDRMRSVAAEIARIPAKSATLDGEVVVVAPDGTTNFADLQASFQEGAKNHLTYFAFDLLHLNGANPRDLPLIERKALLAECLQSADPDLLQLSEHLTTSGAEMFHKACELHAEGIVSKRADAPYHPGRSSAWLKSKCLHEQEFVVGGFTPPGKGGPGLGSLLLGFYDETGKILVYAGRTGTGFTQKFSRELRTRLDAITTQGAPFAKLPPGAKRDAIWVEPTLVAQVRFATWTADEQVRQAAFLGLREDKPAAEVRRENAAPTPKASKHTKPPAAAKVSATKPSSAKALPSKAAAKKTPIPLEHPPIRLTHPEKILDPLSGLTKQQLADYYWAVSAAMLPHITGRPLSIVRVPGGIGNETFFQKHANSMLPAGFAPVDVPDKKTGKIDKYIALNTREAIASLAQISVLEVHPWGSRGDDLEHPDRLIFDLDPDESLPWSTLTAAAADVRKRLKSLGLESFLKTTGGKGLHVVVPIEPTVPWPEIKQFCHSFVLRMERENPRLYLTVMTKSARAGKIFLDYLRNERGSTAVAPYSPRARVGVGVAVPLNWSELKLEARPDFRVANFPDWSARLHKDPWAKIFSTTQQLNSEIIKAAGA
jgi:bifunctional non-homologous end joining protein LigD